jgi:hypothetical protein
MYVSWGPYRDVFIHERGCPNEHKVYDKESDEWVVPESSEEEENNLEEST